MKQYTLLHPVHFLPAVPVVLLLACSPAQKTDRAEVPPPISIPDTPANPNKYEVFFENRFVSYQYDKNDSLFYVIQANGAKFYQTPDTTLKPVKSIGHGEHIWVNRILDTTVQGITRKWAECTEYIPRTIRLGSLEFRGNVHEKVYVKMEDLGARELLYLAQKDWYKTYSNSNFSSNTDFSSKLKLEITPIYHDAFYDEKNRNRWYREAISTHYNTMKPVVKLSLDTDDSVLVLTSEPEYEEKRVEYGLVEYIGDLNCYLVLNGYYESHEYSLYNKKTGNRIMDLIGYPCLSPEKKRIVCVDHDPYIGAGELEIIDIQADGSLKRLLHYEFVNWSPVYDPSEIQWVNENEFNLKVFADGHRFKKKETDLHYSSDETGYVRIKIR